MTWPFTFLAILVWTGILGLLCTAILMLICIRELRKLIRQVRHLTATYFPSYLNDDGKEEVKTQVTINEGWNEENPARD